MPGFSLRSQDAWRRHPMLANGYKRPIPNVPLAVGIFAGLVVLDQLYKAVAGDDHHAPKVSVTFEEESFDAPPTAHITTKGGHGHH